MSPSRPLFVLLLAVGLAACVGCGWPEPPRIGQDEFPQVASRFVLDPTIPCDELKASFGVAHLPSADHPGDIDLPYVEAGVVNPGGETLRVWLLPAEPPLGCVVLSIGSSGDAACFLFIAEVLHELGWTVVLYDYQGFGGSTGTPDLEALFGDLGAVIDWTFAQTDFTQVTLMGVSIGTVPTIAQAAQRGEQVNAVILDAPISVVEELRPFADLLDGPLEAFVQLLSPELRVETQLDALLQPTLVFLYGQDGYKSGPIFAELIEAAPTPAVLVEYEQLPHARGPYIETATYFFLVDQLLSGIWTGGEFSPEQTPLALDAGGE